VLACVLIGLHYHSFEASDLHAQMIISATFGGYIIILAGIFAGILAGQPVPRRVVSFKLLSTQIILLKDEFSMKISKD
jgi:hypothetical protein